MSTSDFLATIALLGIGLFFAMLLGKYMSRVYGEGPMANGFLSRTENRLLQSLGIDPQKSMTLSGYIWAFVTVHFIWVVYAFSVLISQGALPLNPAGIASMDWTLALHSAVSFITSTNLQHYSGETGASYLSQIAVFTFLQFVSAAASLAVGVAVVRCLRKNGAGLRNFYLDFVRSLTRILLPLSLIVSVVFIFKGMPMTLDGPAQIVTLQGDTTSVATGPVAAMISIKELGSNGGGFFGTNDAHAFENPDFFTYCIHYLIVLLIPLAFIFFIGYFLENRALSRMILVVMAAGFLLVTIPIITQETGGNPALSALGIDDSAGNTEGKEVRFGSYFSALYVGENASVPAGTIVGMHDSFMPLSGLMMLIGMQTDCFFGGLGTGWINFFLYLIVAVFLGSLMIGRTPEFLGRKIGVADIKVVVGASVLQLLVPMVLTGIAVFVQVSSDKGWLSNPGAHGLTTMYYEFVSSVAGNGSGFEGLGDNTPFWNLSTSIAMLSGRFIPVLAALYVAWRLSQKKVVPANAGSFQGESATFGAFLFATIIVLNVLSSFALYALGPIYEYFALRG